MFREESELQEGVRCFFPAEPTQINMSTSAPKINVRFWYVCGYWFSATQKCILHKGIIKENGYIWIRIFFLNSDGPTGDPIGDPTLDGS